MRRIEFWLPFLVSASALLFSVYQGYRQSERLVEHATLLKEQTMALQAQLDTLREQSKALVGQWQAVRGAYSNRKKEIAIEIWRDWDRAFTEENRKVFDRFGAWLTGTASCDVKKWLDFFVPTPNATRTQSDIDARYRTTRCESLSTLFGKSKPTVEDFEHVAGSLTTILNVMEGIAIVYQQNVVDGKMIDYSFKSVIPQYVDQLGPFIEAYRREVPKAWEPLTAVTDVWKKKPEVQIEKEVVPESP
jgi:hypothetical protein